MTKETRKAELMEEIEALLAEKLTPKAAERATEEGLPELLAEKVLAEAIELADQVPEGCIKLRGELGKITTDISSSKEVKADITFLNTYSNRLALASLGGGGVNVIGVQYMLSSETPAGETKEDDGQTDIEDWCDGQDGEGPAQDGAADDAEETEPEPGTETESEQVDDEATEEAA